MSVFQLQRVESNGTVVSLGMNVNYTMDDNHFNLQLIPKQDESSNAAVNNDLTGNTMITENSVSHNNNTIQRTTTTNTNGNGNVFEDFLNLETISMGNKKLITNNSRRLSISEYNVDNAGYYEYEYFGKHTNSDERKRENANNNDDDIIMMSDDELHPPIKNEMAMNMGNNNEMFEFDVNLDVMNYDQQDQQQQGDHTLVQDHNPLIDMYNGIEPLISDQQQQPSKKKVKDFFKLNIFGSSGNNNNNNSNSNNNNNSTNGNANNEAILHEEPIVKRKYFWNRNPSKKKNNNVITRRRSSSTFLTDEEEEEVADIFTNGDDIIVEEIDSNIVINPSELLTNSTTYHEHCDHYGDQCDHEDDPADDDDDAHIDIEPISQFTVFGSTNNSSKSSPSIISAISSATANANTNSVIRKKIGMPKTRGRKPSPIPDASKQFGCEYCDRRFKRQEHLKRHVRSLHMCEKPFDCHICGKKFSRSDNLNQHIKTHTHQ